MPRTPYQIVSAVEQVREDPKSVLVAVTRGLEREALHDPPHAVASTLQDVRFLTPATRAVYAGLAARGAPGRLFARSLQSWLAPGVTGIALAEDDPLVDEWTVVLPSAKHPVVFAATDCRGPHSEDGERMFRWALSRDAAVVRAAGEVLGLSFADDEELLGRP